MTSKNDPPSPPAPSPEPDLSQRYTILRSTKEGPVAPRDVAGQIARELVRELKRLKVWLDPAPPLPPFRAAFGMDAMAFTMWIQLVLIPRLLEIEAGEVEIPKSSQLSAHAVREFDGEDEYRNLIDLLYHVDELSGPFDVMAGSSSRGVVYTAAYRKYGVLLILAVLVAAVVGWFGSEQICGWLETRYSPMLFQRIEKVPSPGTGFQDVLADLTFAVNADSKLRPEALSLVLARDFRQSNRGVTRPLELRANDVFERQLVEDWMAAHELDPGTESAARTARAIERIVEAMRTTHARDQIATLPARIGNGVELGSLFEAEPRVPEPVSLTVLVLSLLLTTIPTMLVLVRWMRTKMR